MEWNDIRDPKGEFDFHMEWTLVASEYIPNEIQKMIEEVGVQGMVHTVNEHFRHSVHGHNTMRLGYVGERKAVVQF